jgi:hypothetical protein
MTRQDLLEIFKKEYPTRKDNIIRVETRNENSIFVTIDTGILVKYIFTYKDKTDYSLKLA